MLPHAALTMPENGASLQAPAAKKAATQPRTVPPCTHEVQVPKDFDMASIKLDPEIYGALSLVLCKSIPFL